MKLKINKRLKIALISILVILIGTSSFLLYMEIKHPGFEEQKISVYSYNNKSTVNYKIFLKPNILYDTNPLDEGKIYITEFIDYIKATFNYEFSGEREADIEGTYDIITKAEGFIIEKEEIKIIWEKDFVIIPQKSFSITDKTKSIKEEIEVRLDEYNTFVKEIIETSKINCQTRLYIIMNINVKGNTDKGSIEETISPNMVMSLNTNMFQISGNTNIDKSGAIEETKQVQIPVDKRQFVFYCIILGILILALILLVFFTKGVLVKDPLEKKIKGIFKKHGDRLVALNSELAITCDCINKVKSIDDLVRIADEVGKPIMYKYSKDYKEINKFYVTNEDELYILDLYEVLTKGENPVLYKAGAQNEQHLSK